MASRPTVTIATADGKPSGATLPLPAVFTAPIRPDIVQYAYRNPEITGGEENDARKGDGGEKVIGLTL